MRRFCLNKNWLFHIEDEEYKKTNDPYKKDEPTTFGFFKTGEATGFAARRYENAAWETVDLPHDYVVELPHEITCRSHNGIRPVNDCQYGDGLSLTGHAECPTFPIAWYRKEFFLTEDGKISEDHAPLYGTCDAPAPVGTRYFLQLDGVYRDWTLWVNGVYVDRFLCGYLGATVDITDQLLFGETNSIAIRVDCSQYDGWWYDGGGIYRDVYLLETSDVYCHQEDLYVHASVDGTVTVKADLHNRADAPRSTTVELVIKDAEAEKYRWKQELELKDPTHSLEQKVNLEAIHRWDLDTPYLYTLELYLNGELEQSVAFGFKDVRFDPELGFFLNGRSLKINGMCLHQDFPGVGVAMTKDMMLHRVVKLKEMGVNAIRAVHNPPSPEFLDVCDRMGILVMNETRMFGSSSEALAQLKQLVKRDRNHACVFLWSLGNEEHTVQSTYWGARMTKTAKKAIEALCVDPIVTFGGNNGRHYEGINSQLDVRGINYIRISKNFHPDDYHEKYPHQSLFCSEEASVMSTRGCYKTDLETGFVDAYGHNCAPWGTTPMGYMKFATARPYFAGSFLWTGYDYRGEPAPFGGVKVRNPMGHFGIMDLCGFPKDIYYYYRAHWCEEPLVHLLPAWDFEQGEEVTVYAFTNCEEVTLYLNDRVISTIKLQPYDVPQWTVSFEPGELKIVGKKGSAVVTDVRRTTKTDALTITTERFGEYVFATVDAVDQYKDTVNSDGSVLKIVGENAQVIGVANGDPALKTRERYRKDRKILQLPPLKGDRPLPAFKPADPTYMREEKDPRYEDEYRLLWDIKPEPAEEYVFSCEFEAEDEYSYVEFAGILGESCIRLDGTPIGSTPPCNSLIRKRPYRFDCAIPKGKHKLEVTMNVSESCHCALDSAVIGTLMEPEISYPLFHGKMLIVVKPDKNGTLTVRDEKGHCASALL